MLNGVPSWRFLTEAMMTLDRIAVPIAGASLLAFVAVHAVKRQWQAMMALVIFAAGGAFLSQSLKALVGRARPPGVALVEVSGYSFPSGQVLAFTLVAGWAIHMASASSASRPIRVLVGASVAAAVLLVGLSRIYLGAHYPSDVAASVLVGISWLCLCIAALRSPDQAGWRVVDFARWHRGLEPARALQGDDPAFQPLRNRKL